MLLIPNGSCTSLASRSVRRWRRAMRLASDRKRKLEDQFETLDNGSTSAGSSEGGGGTPPNDEPVIAPIHINPAYLPVDAYHGVPPRSMIL